ncbi:exported hypothetical protein [Paraburkholderia ribeironis]|uniref:Uncharacterized protein n=1 Tax=Paraburkholderia ribeironis TaxID=1247936 RepID=A0A1N7SNH6_9BURK|nr:exported hypothetical protein [Paraburkholderia ribeironis]
MPGNIGSGLVMGSGFAPGQVAQTVEPQGFSVRNGPFRVPRGATSICLTLAVRLRYVPLVERRDTARGATDGRTSIPRSEETQ